MCTVLLKHDVMDNKTEESHFVLFAHLCHRTKSTHMIRDTLSHIWRQSLGIRGQTGAYQVTQIHHIKNVCDLYFDFLVWPMSQPITWRRQDS